MAKIFKFNKKSLKIKWLYNNIKNNLTFMWEKVKILIKWVLISQMILIWVKFWYLNEMCHFLKKNIFIKL